MYVRPRPRFRPRNAGGVPFSPALLFTSGVAGAWYDPSDVLLNWRTNLLTYSTLAGAVAGTPGTAGTDWGIVSTGGNLTNVTADTEGNNILTFASSAARVYFTRAYVVATSTTYTYSATINSNTGILFYECIYILSLPAGATMTFFANGVSVDALTYVPVANDRLSIVLAVAGTSGTVNVRIGAGVGGSVTGTVAISRPQLELGSTATTYQAITTPEQTYLLYDPQPVLYQDSAGTTPVTAVEQPVRLMLDKSQGLVLGSQLAPATTSVSGWVPNANCTIASVSGEIEITATAIGVCVADFLTASPTGVSNYLLTAVARCGQVGGSAYLGAGHGSVPYSAAATSTTNTPLTVIKLKTAGGSEVIRLRFDSTAIGQKAYFSQLSCRELPGNHALAPNDLSRPVLRARYNQLTYSEQFDNAVWNKLSAGTGSVPVVTANYATAPDGTTTADRVVFDRGAGTTASDISYLNQSITSISADCTGSIWMRTTDGSTKVISFRVGNTFNYTASVTGTWTRFTLTGTSPVARLDLLAYGDRSVQVTDLLVWGADLRTGSSAGTYQRIAAATDYATAGFLPYLALDGTDDSFGTNSIDFTATDKMSVCAGVTKLSDAVQVIAELSANSDSTAGTFYLANVATSTLRHQVAGSPGGATRALGDTTLTNPSTAVVTQQFNIAGASVATQIVVRQNGVAQTLASTAGTAGTGNFSSNPLFIGRRNNASFPFNGRIYQLIVCGKTLSASELASTEAYVATKTGVTL